MTTIHQLIAQRDQFEPLAPEAVAIQARIDEIADPLTFELSPEAIALFDAHAAAVALIN